MHNENWHPGVIGIVASRLVEKFYRPTVLLATIDGVAKGSARSISNFNIYEALQKCEEHLIHFGGHQAAAGLAMEIDKVEDFRKAFNKVVKESINEEDLLPELAIDAKIKFSDITPKFFRILEQFAPFGPGNLRPVFLAENVEVSNTPRVVGNNHLLLCVKQKSSKKIFDCIGFNMGQHYENLIKNNSGIDIVFSIDKTIRDTRIFPQLKLKDIKFKDAYEEN